MSLFHSRGSISLKIKISYENQDKMNRQALNSFLPLFNLKRDEIFSVCFENKLFTCTYKGKRESFSYKSILKAETNKDGIIIYLDNQRYISVATDKTEKHNSQLYDIVLFLKCRCRKAFLRGEEIQYPDLEDGRYKSCKEPVDKISFTLSHKELRRIIRYDYLIGEGTIARAIPIIIGASVSLLLQSIWLAILSAIVLVISVVLTVMYVKESKGFIKNHQGLLHAFLYDDLLVIRLSNTDLELEFEAMKRLKSIWGLLRIKSGDFFALTLPLRVEKENPAFFEALYSKIAN